MFTLYFQPIVFFRHNTFKLAVVLLDRNAVLRRTNKLSDGDKTIYLDNEIPVMLATVPPYYISASHE
jgi:hypothetical protein